MGSGSRRAVRNYTAGKVPFMGTSKRVALQLPDTSEIRYLSRLPIPGERIKDSSGTWWIVSDVDNDTVGGYVVTCDRKASPRPT
jgi:hypothetical protein